MAAIFLMMYRVLPLAKGPEFWRAVGERRVKER